MPTKTARAACSNNCGTTPTGDWGERYGLLACQHYLKSKAYIADDNYERLAASLPVSDDITARIAERLRLLPTDHPKYEDIAELAEYYRQKSQFAALLP